MALGIWCFCKNVCWRWSLCFRAMYIVCDERIYLTGTCVNEQGRRYILWILLWCCVEAKQRHIWSCNARLWVSLRQSVAWGMIKVWVVCRRLGAHGQPEYCGMIKGLNCVEERSGRHGRLGPCRQPECCVISDPLFFGYTTRYRQFKSNDF
jgi:hypothetical protein